MTAEPKPKFDPKSEAEKLIAETQNRYTDALHLARKAAATTATEGWQTNYAAQRKASAKLIAANVGDITSIAEAIEQNGTCEESEKAIKDAVKALAEERERMTAWTRRAVDPYSATVFSCDVLRQEAVRDGKKAEEGNPLLARGLADAVSAIVAMWPMPTWDVDAGVVRIVEPPSATA